MMFEPIDSWDVPRCLRRPGLPEIYGTKKPMNTGLTGCFSQSFQVEPPGVEPGSKQATPAAFSMLSPRLIFDQRLTVDGPSLT